MIPSGESSTLSINKKDLSESLSRVSVLSSEKFRGVPDGSVSRHGSWHEKDGIFYSKNNCFHTTKSTIGFHYGKTYTPRYQTYDDYWYDDEVCNTGTSFNTPPTYDMSDTSSVYGTAPDHDMFSWQDINLVAVYGTLKAGRSNHIVLGGSSYIGAGKTVSKYAMQASGDRKSVV